MTNGQRRPCTIAPMKNTSEVLVIFEFVIVALSTERSAINVLIQKTPQSKKGKREITTAVDLVVKLSHGGGHLPSFSHKNHHARESHRYLYV